MGFKVQMTSFRSQKLWFDHVALYYDYYVTPWINSSQFKMSSAESELSVRKLWKWEFIWHMEWWWWRKRTRTEWKLRCAVCVWAKSTNSQCREQQYTAAYFIRQTRTRTFRKSGPYTKIYCKTHFRQTWGRWFQIWQSFFTILAQKYSIRHFWSQI